MADTEPTTPLSPPATPSPATPASFELVDLIPTLEYTSMIYTSCEGGHGIAIPPPDTEDDSIFFLALADAFWYSWTGTILSGSIAACNKRFQVAMLFANNTGVIAKEDLMVLFSPDAPIPSSEDRDALKQLFSFADVETRILSLPGSLIRRMNVITLRETTVFSTRSTLMEAVGLDIRGQLEQSKTAHPILKLEQKLPPSHEGTVHVGTYTDDMGGVHFRPIIPDLTPDHTNHMTGTLPMVLDDLCGTNGLPKTSIAPHKLAQIMLSGDFVAEEDDDEQDTVPLYLWKEHGATFVGNKPHIITHVIDAKDGYNGLLRLSVPRWASKRGDIGAYLGRQLPILWLTALAMTDDSVLRAACRKSYLQTGFVSEVASDDEMKLLEAACALSPCESLPALPDIVNGFVSTYISARHFHRADASFGMPQAGLWPRDVLMLSSIEGNGAKWMLVVDLEDADEFRKMSRGYRAVTTRNAVKLNAKNAQKVQTINRSIMAFAEARIPLPKVGNPILLFDDDVNEDEKAALTDMAICLGWFSATSTAAL